MSRENVSGRGLQLLRKVLYNIKLNKLIVYIFLSRLTLDIPILIYYLSNFSAVANKVINPRDNKFTGDGIISLCFDATKTKIFVKMIVCRKIASRKF